jgi:hypothetical protein
MTVDPTTAVWLALLEEQRRTVRPSRRARMWERIARRRAEIIAHLTSVNDGYVRRIGKLEDQLAGFVVDAGWKPGLRVSDFITSNDSGREYPQAWQASKPEGTIYREVEGVAQYWPPSVWLNADTERRWTPCGPNFRTLAAIRTFYRRQFRYLVKVPSPDCKNCQGSGTVEYGIVKSVTCPVCCGGS